MTAEGFEQVQALKPHLPTKPALVICGTSRRHIETRLALGLGDTATRWTPVIGGPESPVQNGKVVLLADGTSVPLDSFGLSKSLDERRAVMLAVLGVIPDGAIVCADCDVMSALGHDDVRPAALYQVTFAGAPPFDNLEIKEIMAAQVASTPDQDCLIPG